jgi:hypothetical protein
VISGTRASSTAWRQVPLWVISRPSGATMALTPVVEATTTARSASMARIRAMASCCCDSPVWPSTSNVASLVCIVSRFAPAVTSERTRESNPIS